MMKKITSMLLALTMVCGIAQSAFADDVLKSKIVGGANGLIEIGATENYEIVKGGNDESFADDYIKRKEIIPAKTDIKVEGVDNYTAKKDADTVDIKTTMYLSSVRDAYNHLASSVKETLTDPEKEAFKDLTVTAKFTVTMKTSRTDYTLPADFMNQDKVMRGFVDNDGDDSNNLVNGIFAEKERTISDTKDEIKIVVEVDTTAEKLEANYALSDLVLNIDGVEVKAGDEYALEGTMTGWMKVSEGAAQDDNSTTILYIEFGAVEADTEADGYNQSPVKATINLTAPTPEPDQGGSIMGGGTIAKAPEFDFVVNGEENDDVTVPSTAVTTEGSKVTIDFDKVTIKGHEILGWYLDEDMTQPVEGKYTFTKKTTFYAKTKPVEIETPDINVDGDRFAYIIGYTDGTVRPENNISRQEVATIFFRILTEESREANLTETNSFTDVDSTRWSNRAISTMAAMGVVNGYTDGTFKPEADITRAEFATMAARFIKSEVNAENRFTDVVGHWAEEYIAKAAYAGWVEGNQEGTFNPDNYITRAEVMAIVNRVLKTDKSDDVVSELDPNWIDNPKSAWYYKDVVVATSDFAWDEEYEK